MKLELRIMSAMILMKLKLALIIKAITAISNSEHKN